MVLLSKQDIENAELHRLARLASYGDADAGFMLHSLLTAILSDAAISGVIPMLAAEMLAEMHGSLARGDNAAKAMLVGKPSNRPIRQMEHDRVLAFIADMMAFFDYAEANRLQLEARGMTLPSKRPSKAEIYRRTAAAFGLQFKTVKNLQEATARRIRSPL